MIKRQSNYVINSLWFLTWLYKMHILHFCCFVMLPGITCIVTLLQTSFWLLNTCKSSHLLAPLFFWPSVSQTFACEEINNNKMNVVGWYHSHPTFNPNPSIRDIETQLKFQVIPHSHSHSGFRSSKSDSDNFSHSPTLQWTDQISVEV